jgi:hypothetical protein
MEDIEPQPNTDMTAHTAALALIARRADAAIASGEFTARPLTDVLEIARGAIHAGPVAYVCAPPRAETPYPMKRDKRNVFRPA